MGYTHYWNRPLKLDKKKFAAWSADVRYLMERLPKHSLSAGGYHANEPLVIRGPWGGDDEPTVTDELVAFNGDDREGRGMAHEGFAIAQVFEPLDYQLEEARDKRGRIKASHKFFDFCKTERKPYDLLVCAALIAFKYHFGKQVGVSSDGRPADWAMATLWYLDVFDDRALGEGPWPASTTLEKEPEQEVLSIEKPSFPEFMIVRPEYRREKRKAHGLS